MTQPWNLTVNEWSNVLEDGTSPEDLSQQLFNGTYLPWVDTMVEHTKDSKDVLDLGCGRGQLAAILAKQGKDTTLFDWSQNNLTYCEKLFGVLNVQGKFIQGDMTKRLPFDDGAFDTVYSCGVFEYFSDDEIVGIIKEMKRIARKRIIILVPNARSVAYRLGKWYMEMKKKWQWGGERPFATLKKYLRANDITRISEATYGTNHSLRFLNVPGGRTIRKVLNGVFGVHDHSRPSTLRQGYILVTIGELEREK